jgi:hypothetical protein
MTILMIDYHVEDFNRWKAVFDSDPMDRTSHGVVKHWIYRDPDDPNHHVLGMEFVGAEQTKAFREALAPMWEVSGAGQAWILEQVEQAETHTPMRNVAAKPTSYFVYKLISPRPTFPVDISDAEAAIMEQHFAYWSRFEQRGIVVVLGRCSTRLARGGSESLPATTGTTSMRWAPRTRQSSRECRHSRCTPWPTRLSAPSSRNAARGRPNQA